MIGRFVNRRCRFYLNYRGSEVSSKLERSYTILADEETNLYKNPCAADVIYGNPDAIQNRLQLFHLFRLQMQAKLDLPELQKMRKDWSTDRTTNPLRITYTMQGNLPGVESQFAPESGAVTIAVDVEALGLDQEQRALFMKLVGDKYAPDTNELVYIVSHFPFREMNIKLSFDILQDLLSYCKEGKERFHNVILPTVPGKKKAHLEFPADWLPKKEPVATDIN